MLVTKVTFAALCCFIAQAVRCARAEGDTVHDASTVVTQAAAGQRTLLQEMLIFSKMFDITPFNGVGVNGKPAPIKGINQSTRVEKIRAELTMLKGMIDTQNGVLNSQQKVDVPNYKGLNRYTFLKGLLNSMALKFENVREFLLSATVDEPADLKNKLVELKIGVEGDIVDDLSLFKLKSFYKQFYGADAPIPNLRKFFSDYDGKKTTQDPLSATSNPLTTFFSDGNVKGDDLSAEDQANVDMILYARPGNLPFLLPGDAARRSTEGTLEDGSDMATEDTLEENKNTLAGREEAVDSGVSRDPTPKIVIPGPSGPNGLPAAEPLPTGELSPVQLPTVPKGEGSIGSPTLDEQEDNADEVLPAEPSPSSAAPSPSAAATSKAVEPRTSETSSLRTAAGEASPQKASSAFDSFVTMLLVVSAVFTL